MSKLFKLGLVLLGYVLAFVAAYIISWLRERALQEMDPAQFSGGMQAFGDMLFFLGLFGALSLIPTAMALWFLRPFLKFWNFLSIAALYMASTAPVAVILFLLTHSPMLPDWVKIISFISLMKIMATPFFAFGFLITAFISPPQPRRWALFTAAAIEGAVGISALAVLAVVVCFLH
jgi:hypothetical protein